MEIVRREAALGRVLDNRGPDGQPEQRTYYDTAASRVVLTTLPGNSVQKAHHHERLVEVTYVVSGSLVVSEVTDGGIKTAVLGEGDLVSWAPGIVHWAANGSSDLALTLTFKFARPLDLTADDFRALAETDWHAD